MSYARFGADGSDVYVYLDVGGYLTCCSCVMLPERPSGFHEWFKAYTTADMIEHLEKHQAEGHCVPYECLKRLRSDHAETDARILELQAENAKASGDDSDA